MFQQTLKIMQVISSAFAEFFQWKVIGKSPILSPLLLTLIALTSKRLILAPFAKITVPSTWLVIVSK